MTTASYIYTDSRDAIFYFDTKGNPIWRCRCGNIHVGDYAAYEYGHHNCFHETDLMLSAVGPRKYQIFCPQCGMTWVGDVEETWEEAQKSLKGGQTILYTANYDPNPAEVK